LLKAGGHRRDARGAFVRPSPSISAASLPPERYCHACGSANRMCAATAESAISVPPCPPLAATKLEAADWPQNAILTFGSAWSKAWPLLPLAPANPLLKSDPLNGDSVTSVPPLPSLTRIQSAFV